jgi:hypothetical protein
MFGAFPSNNDPWFLCNFLLPLLGSALCGWGKMALKFGVEKIKPPIKKFQLDCRVRKRFERHQDNAILAIAPGCEVFEANCFCERQIFWRHRAQDFPFSVFFQNIPHSRVQGTL